ncbi:MAG: Tagatose 1,6-bisphosphate aldolase [uncultured Quadrisphaera sp.]|uniref:Tagatose 1,6-bisphosphate aldolase n=1 Tax=uncultured Quadrisphaera sp. TaxID=904978 RepID=A0A6J4NNJ5_9ACTN|nr:MAG: Tagatose 1,6-bisphosphate aldolase [uncultured Quadrisphaera sp.]
MPLVPVRDLLAAAAAGPGALLAFNAVTLEHVQGVVTGAERAGRPVVVAVSQNAVRYAGGDPAPLAAAAVAVAQRSATPVGLHLDHVEDERLLRRTAEIGFSSVMVDASALPYDANVAKTRAAVAWAAGHGVLVEAELGQVGGKDGRVLDAHAPGARTDPREAAAFVAATGVQALAVAVGSSHAMTSRTASLDLELVAALASAVDVPLVLHGSSGVPDDVLAAGVAAGLVKVNVGTLLGVAFTAAVREVLADEAVVDPRTYLRPAREAVAAQVARTLALLGT